ncbi:MAG TPA: type II toxin-antitoxin system PemK/MazF family toxin [Candidatus Obscuribacterales bacterium]
MTQQVQAGDPQEYRRGEVWWVDFGAPLGREAAFFHPAVIVSKQEFNEVAPRLGWLIVVPGTSTRLTVPRTDRIPVTHYEVANSPANCLDHTTYFQCEQVRCVSTLRMRRLIGMIEKHHLREIEDRLCLVMDLFKR